MTGKVEFSAVVCIVLVAAVQCTASEGLLRSRRQTPPLPAALPPMMTPPRLPARPNLWSCCPRAPMVLKHKSKTACMVGQPRPPMPMTGGPMPGGPGGPMPLPGGPMPLPGGPMPLPGGMTPPAGVPLPSGPPSSGVPRINPGNYSCFVQCAYQNQSLVVGGVLSIDAVKTRLTELAQENPAWADVFKGAALACTANAPVVPANAPCKSGAAEINSCLNNYVLKNCAAGTRVESDVCTGLRQNVTLPQWG